MIQDYISQLDKIQKEHDLDVDFAVVTDVDNATVDIQLVQRNFKYESCILLGNYVPEKNEKGIVFFVSKSKYPCFLPLYFKEDSNEYEVGTFNLDSKPLTTSEDGFTYHSTGIASWYGDPNMKLDTFHGRTTANGEKYNTHAFTAAHKTLPFNTILRVTNLSNNKFITVRINDRGPYIAGRIIDLSYASKTAIMGTDGLAEVKLEIKK